MIMADVVIDHVDSWTRILE